MTLGSIRTWEILTWVAYVSSVPVWLALVRRRRLDLLAVAIFVQVTALLRQEQLEFVETESTSNAGSSLMYTTLYNENVVEQIGLFAIDWGVAVVFIYSAALVSIFHERIAIAAVFVVLVILRSTETATALLIGFRLVVTIPLFTFYIYERLTRDTLVLLNISLYVSGFAFFYAAFLLSVIPLINTDPVMHVIIHFFWIILLNLGLFLIILSIPATQKVNLVVHNDDDWMHGEPEVVEAQMRVVLHDRNHWEHKLMTSHELRKFIPPHWEDWDTYIDASNASLHVVNNSKTKRT